MLNSPIEEIKNRLDILEVVGSYIKLQKAGANYRAVCPFHSEKKPSFFVSPVRQRWHCFGACSEGGDIFKFVMKINGVEFGDALRMLAQKAGVELKKQDPKIRTERQRSYEILEIACCFFEKQLGNSLSGKEAREYLIKRGIKEESIKNWRLGYSPDDWQGLSDFLVSRGYSRQEIEKAGLCLKSQKTNRYYDRFRGRIMFPVFDLSHQAVGFGGRIFKQVKRADQTEEAKYVNTPATLLYDKSRILYGLNKAGIDVRKNNSCVLVEGYTDAILAHQSGFKNVVATSGTALTDYQLRILKRYSDNLSIAFDMDIAGDSATKRGIDLAQSLGFNIKIVSLDEKDTDPADIISQNPQKWENLVNNAKTIYDFYFDSTLSRFDKNTLEGKKEISKLLLPVIKRIPNRIEQTYWVQGLAQVLEAKEEDVLEELLKIKEEEGPEERAGEFTEKKDYLPAKSRKELLEEYLIILIMKFPKNLDLIKEQDFDFLSPQTLKIISNFRDKGINDFPVEYKELLDTLCLKAEIEFVFAEKSEGKEFSQYIEEEFKKCLKEIRSLVVKDKLDQICQQIKKAEGERNFEKVRDLTEQFNNFSKSRCDLETA